MTVDIDLCYRRTRDNLKKLAAALREIKPSLRNAPKDLPFIIDEQTLALGNNFTFETPFSDLDLLGFLEPLGDYEVISKRAVPIQIAHLTVKVIHIDVENLWRLQAQSGLFIDLPYNESPDLDAWLCEAFGSIRFPFRGPTVIPTPK